MSRSPDTVALRNNYYAVAKGRPQARLTEWLCLGTLSILILVYVVAYSSKSISAYATGNTLFDLGTFEQGFWNATNGTLFFHSLEGEMSRFGRHFSPIFILILPFYALHRDPTTLLFLQSLALGLAAVPLYLFARSRLANAPIALLMSALYLASPVVHDVNIVNEFHEIAFIVPLLFLAFYAIETERWRLYALAAVGALLVKEEAALTVAALGIYVLVFTQRRRIGLATALGSLFWLVLVVEVLMPALRGSHGPVPFPGYDYLGKGIFGIAVGVVTKTSELLRVMTESPKQEYLYWLLEPVGFLALLAPEVLLVALPALLEVLASTFPPTYQIFERYAAPIIPFVFVAAVVATGRIRHLLQGARVPRVVMGSILIIVAFGMVGATLHAQLSLHKYPTQLLYPTDPEPHSAMAIKFTQVIPERASVVVEDHRWIARLAHRRYLYFLSGHSPDAEYLLLDRKVPPITNVPQQERETAIRRITGSNDYLRLRCEDGLSLYARRDAHERDGDLFTPYDWEHDRQDNFGNLIQLRGYSFDKPTVRPGETEILTLYWQALREPIGADYTVFVHVLDKQQRGVAQHDRRPQDSACITVDWKQGEIVRDPHPLAIKSGVAPGEYEVRVGLYTLADVKRLSVIGSGGVVLGDSVALGALTISP